MELHNSISLTTLEGRTRHITASRSFCWSSSWCTICLNHIIHNTRGIHM